MLKIALHIAGFYFIFIGTWRLANATTRSPVGILLGQYEEEARTYNPSIDLVSIHRVLLWIFKELTTFKKPGGFSTATIHHKQFTWGLLWLLVGLILQFLGPLI
jgi:hypothetical protein